MKNSYLQHLREEIRSLESSDPDCLRHLLNQLDNVLAELVRLDDQVQQVAANARASNNAARNY